MPQTLPSTPALARMRERAAADLATNILPFWAERSLDADGWLVGTVRDDLTVDPSTPRHSVLASRMLWTFAEAAREDIGGQRDTWLDTGRKALALVTDKFWDDAHGGVVWSLDQHGEHLSDRKQVYGQAFTIYGLAAWSRATGDMDALARAMGLFELLEAHSRDHELGGYWEAHSREWGELDDMALSSADMSVPKSMNTNLHVLEAYSTLLDVSGDARVAEALAALLDATVTHIVRTEPWTYSALFFDREWNSHVDTISYGHDIEASWLIYEALEALQRANEVPAGLAERARKATVDLADAVLAHGVDPDGGVMYEGGPEGVRNGAKDWWPQAEGVVGWLGAYQVGGDQRHLDAALKTWDFLDEHVIDHDKGEWWARLDRDLRPMVEHENSCRIGPWKCPYHNGRACLEIMRRIEAP